MSSAAQIALARQATNLAGQAWRGLTAAQTAAVPGACRGQATAGLPCQGGLTAANRINGLKGGVKTAEGKAISRMNALKHGIFATALMECQSDGYFAALLDELNAELKPVGIVEQLLVDKLAVTYLRMRRCAQAETLRFEARWRFNPTDFGKFPFDESVVAIGLYDARLTKQFLRLLNEIAARQKHRTMRNAECGMRNAEARAPSERLDSRPATQRTDKPATLGKLRGNDGGGENF